MRQRRATPKCGGLVVAVAAIAKEAEQQHNDGENRDQYHEQPSGTNFGDMRDARRVKQSLSVPVARRNV
jgi:hypothetical protein